MKMEKLNEHEQWSMIRGLVVMPVGSGLYVERFKLCFIFSDIILRNRFTGNSTEDQIFRLTGGLSRSVWCETQHDAACLIV